MAHVFRPNGFLVVLDLTLLRPDPPQEIAELWRGIYPGIGTPEEGNTS
jgi:hypothetical protein